MTSSYARTTINSQAALKISSVSISRQTASSSSYLLMQPSLFLSQSGASTTTAQDYYRWPPSQIRRQKVHMNGLRLVISILATNTTCKIYVLSAPLRQSCSSHYCTLALCLIDANHKDFFCQDQLSPCQHRVRAQVRWPEQQISLQAKASA